jgi:hypothetical protein
MLIGLALERTTGDTRAEPILGIGSFVVLAALLAFTINLLRNAGRPALSGEPRAEVR